MSAAPERKRPPKPVRWLIAGIVYAGLIGWFAWGSLNNYLGVASPRSSNHVTGQVVAANWKGVTIYVLPWQAPFMSSWFPMVYFAAWAAFAFTLGPWAYPDWQKPRPPPMRWRPKL